MKELVKEALQNLPPAGRALADRVQEVATATQQFREVQQAAATAAVEAQRVSREQMQKAQASTDEPVCCKIGGLGWNLQKESAANEPKNCSIGQTFHRVAYRTLV